MIRSLYLNQAELIAAMTALHFPEGVEADVTFGNGVFWRDSKRPTHCFDVDPVSSGVVEADSRLLPLAPESISSAAFDPPFLTYVRAGRGGNGRMAMARRFSGYWTIAELRDHYVETISELWRVLKRGGRFFIKCQDIVHNHRLEPIHAEVLLWADLEGFRLLDSFVLGATHRMPGPNRAGAQRHARVFHSHFLVFEKPKARGSRRVA